MTTSVIPAAVLSSPGTDRVLREKRGARGANRIGHYIMVRLLPTIPTVFIPVTMVFVFTRTIGASKRPNTRRLLTSLPVRNLAEQAMRRGELRMLRVEDRP